MATIGGTWGTLFGLGSILNGLLSENIMMYTLARKMYRVKLSDNVDVDKVDEDNVDDDKVDDKDDH